MNDRSRLQLELAALDLDTSAELLESARDGLDEVALVTGPGHEGARSLVLIAFWFALHGNNEDALFLIADVADWMVRWSSQPASLEEHERRVRFLQKLCDPWLRVAETAADAGCRRTATMVLSELDRCTGRLRIPMSGQDRDRMRRVREQIGLQRR